MEWYRANGRELPWRGIDDPYKVWLSEIILQQTRVAQGMPYYLSFTKAFPTVAHLAKASEQEVLNLWQGLGYYSRARNLHAAAKYVANDLDGVFPNNYRDLLKLKGVGDYTASAIASIVFNEPKAVIDGNVFRVVSRLFLVEDNIADTRSKPVFAQIANELLDRERPGDFNQAIMDFGAMQCSPKPECGTCPLTKHCRAYELNSQRELPVKIKNLKRRKRYFHYFYLHHNSLIYLKRRSGKDIWKGLYELPLIETEGEAFPQGEMNDIGVDALNAPLPPVFKKVHKLTHQDIIGIFYSLNAEPSSDAYECIEFDQLEEYPVSRLTDEFFRNLQSGVTPSLFE